jgi:esterase/lipase superfamily enzyme
MGELSPAAVNIAILAAGLFLYALIWYLTRGLPPLAKALARLLPLGLVLPAMILLSNQPRTLIRDLATAPPLPTSREPVPPSAGPPPASEPPASEPKTAVAPPVAPPSLPTPPPAPRSLPTAQAPTPAAPPEPEKGTTRSLAGPPPGAPAAVQEDWDVVPVFYGTDRVRKDQAKRPVYSSERARRLELGQALVTVPKTHQVPNIERPFAIRIPYFQVTIYEGAEDPKSHFTIKDMAVLSRDEFLAKARERVDGSSAFKDQAIVFVHGYNNAFDYALYRTAQMAYDLKFDGAAFLYSWPSLGDFSGYGYDRESSQQAEPYLRQYLELVLRETGAKQVSIIAHSMGNLPLLQVLRDLGPTLPPDVRLNQIIMAAPDVDRNVFENIAADLQKYGRGLTLYASANDRAMQAARRVAGGVPRAGDVPIDGPIIIDGIDTIDVTQTSLDYLALNHSVYAEKSALLNDIGLLLQTGERPPDKRIPILQMIESDKGKFWRYPAAR